MTTDNQRDEAERPQTITDELLADYANRCRINACGAWSAIEAQGDLARAWEERLRGAITELEQRARQSPQAESQPEAMQMRQRMTSTDERWTKWRIAADEDVARFTMTPHPDVQLRPLYAQAESSFETLGVALEKFAKPEHPDWNNPQPPMTTSDHTEPLAKPAAAPSPLAAKA